MKKLLFISIILIAFTSIILIAGCNQNKTKITYLECNKDNDCGVGGCSGQICGSKDTVKNIITTCEFKPEYECLKLTSCKCINARCQWEENNQYNECLTSTE